MRMFTIASLLVMSILPGHVIATQTGSRAMMITECFIINNSAIALNQKTSSMPQLSAANYGHEIERGNGYVFAMRKYSDDGHGVDSAHFEKVTLSLAITKINLAVGQTIPVAVSQGFFTEGGVGFIHKGEYWRAKKPNPIPKIVLFKTSNGLSVRLDSTFGVAYVSNANEKDVHIKLTCPVRTVSVDQLGPWEGKVGVDWNSFSPKNLSDGEGRGQVLPFAFSVPGLQY